MHVTVERTVPRPADEVFGFFADATNNPQWQKGMQRCEWITDGPIGVGSRYRQEAEFMGRPVVSTFEVTAFEPGRSITIDTVESTFPIHVTRSVEPIDDTTTRVRADISGGPGGVFRLIAPLTDRMAKRSIEADYDRLVELLAERPG